MKHVLVKRLFVFFILLAFGPSQVGACDKWPLAHEEYPRDYRYYYVTEQRLPQGSAMSGMEISSDIFRGFQEISLIWQIAGADSPKQRDFDISEGYDFGVPITNLFQGTKTMKKISLHDVEPYAAPKHFAMTALKLHGLEESGASKFWMGLSHFLPGGGAEWDASPVEKIYFVLEGEITVKTAEETLTLGPWDSLFIGAGEGREIINQTNRPVSMLVVINYPA